MATRTLSNISLDNLGTAVRTTTASGHPMSIEQTGARTAVARGTVDGMDVVLTATNLPAQGDIIGGLVGGAFDAAVAAIKAVASLFSCTPEMRVETEYKDGKIVKQTITNTCKR